ncbi:MAG TPA: sulfite exporter TauE/SafE family protein [Polyangiaceae bacterium]|nr:sulfite exporter TauE/SafE family protein [Polyangiaceae bacterium]
MKNALVVALTIAGLVFLGTFIASLVTTKERIRPTAYEVFVGAFTNFFDTLGIGSFAPTTTFYRARKTIDDRLIPGTLNVGHTIPTFAEAYIFMDKVAVDPRTLVAMIASATLGAIVGAPVVAKMTRSRVQLGMGIALLVVCAILVRRQFAFHEDGDKLGFEGGIFWFAVAMNFVFGALMTIGVGLYAPCLIMVTLLGMNPKSGFPIMMGSCAFLQALGSIPFIRTKSFAPGASVGLSLGGIPAVLAAAFIVKSLDLYWVKWLVAVVVVYTAFALLRAARSKPAT